MSALPMLQGSMAPVGAGQTAVFKFELTHRYFGILLRPTGFSMTPAQWGAAFGKIVLKIDGAVIQTWEASGLYQWCTSQGMTLEDDALYIPLTLESLDSVTQRRALGIGTLGLTSFTLEVEIKNPGLGALTTLDVFAEIGANTTLGEHLRVLNFPALGPESAGTRQHVDLFPINVTPYHFMLNSANVGKVVLRKGTQRLYEDDRIARHFLLSKKGFSRGTWDMVDLLPQDDLSGEIPADNGYQFDITTTAGSTFDGHLIGTAQGLG